MNHDINIKTFRKTTTISGEADPLLENKQAFIDCMERAINALGTGIFSKIGNCFKSDYNDRKQKLLDIKNAFYCADSAQVRANALYNFKAALLQHRGIHIIPTKSIKAFVAALTESHLIEIFKMGIRQSTTNESLRQSHV